ncbi:hypothetical protein ACFVWR_02065 [Leifsonia sp. NPDC058292]|uniref:hypothetical protein n=1 Tax=Leifsonia sp. NPDC058292 TaxID=3346428 RepID=UPI0036DAFE74
MTRANGTQLARHPFLFGELTLEVARIAVTPRGSTFARPELLVASVAAARSLPASPIVRPLTAWPLPIRPLPIGTHGIAGTTASALTVTRRGAATTAGALSITRVRAATAGALAVARVPATTAR